MHFSNHTKELFNSLENQIRDQFKKIEQTEEENQFKVIDAFREHKVSEAHLHGSTGYGYGDKGRDDLDKVYASIFHTQDALVRAQIVSGTQALAICLYGILRPGDEVLSITGKPYDTLEEVIGIRGKQGNGSLKDLGIKYSQLDLIKDGKIDLNNIRNKITRNTKMVMIQRSRGYEYRDAVNVQQLGEAICTVKNIDPKIIVMVDNCYGEFVEGIEPTDAGADIIAGSLIKNPGGSLAQTGGYLAGRADLIEKCSYRLTSPGIGREVGASQENNRLMYQGLFLAPHITAESLKGAVLCSAVMEKLGFETSPGYTADRSDIIQAVKFNNEEAMIKFCKGIQNASPIDSFVSPEPWEMPGYESKVIMAAGTFVSGASIELSADGPCIPPYIAYMQGGITYRHVKYALMEIVEKLRT